MKIKQKNIIKRILLSAIVAMVSAMTICSPLSTAENGNTQDAETASIIFTSPAVTNNMSFNDGIAMGIEDVDDPSYSETFIENDLEGRRVYKKNTILMNIDPDYYLETDSIYKITIGFYDFGPSRGTFGLEYRHTSGNTKTLSIVKEGDPPPRWKEESVLITDAGFGKGDFDLKITTNVYNAYSKIEIVNITKAVREGKYVDIGIKCEDEALALSKLNLLDVDLDNTEEFLKADMTRETLLKQFVRVIGKEDEAKREKSKSSFNDISPSFEPYVVWAEKNGITFGTGDGKYAPDNEATVSMALAYFVRYLHMNEAELWKDPIDFAKENFLLETDMCVFFGNATITNDQFAGIAYRAILEDDAKSGQSPMKAMLLSGKVTDKMIDATGDTNLKAYKYIIPHKYPAKKLYDNHSGREYKFIDFEGIDMIRTYFTAQQWNNDATKFVVGADDKLMFEYDTKTETLRFLDFADCTTNRLEAYVNPQDKIFYERRNGDDGIVYYMMDWNTREKKKIATLPEGIQAGENVTPSNDGKLMSIQWDQTDDPRDYYNGVNRSRVLAWLDVETGEFYSHFSHEFDCERGLENMGHPMLNPQNTDLYMFCHEGDAIKTPDRIWMLNTKTGEKWNAFRQAVNEDGTTAEASTHEVWQGNGEGIVFIKLNTDITKGKYGICRVKPDGSDREYFDNGGYNFWHCSSTYDGSFVAGDTNTSPAYIVLTDTRTYESYQLVSYDPGRLWPNDPYQHHVTLSNNGDKVCWEMWNAEAGTYGFAWMDIEDITGKELVGGRIELDESLSYVTYKDSEIDVKKIDGENTFEVPFGKKLYLDVNDNFHKAPTCDVKLKFRYKDEGKLPIMLTYTSSVEADTDLYKTEDKRIQIPRGNTKLWKDAEFMLEDISLNNSCRFLTDFALEGQYSKALISDITVEIINKEGE